MAKGDQWFRFLRFSRNRNAVRFFSVAVTTYGDSGAILRMIGVSSDVSQNMHPTVEQRRSGGNGSACAFVVFSFSLFVSGCWLMQLLCCLFKIKIWYAKALS
jgi:hypothetical protein